MWFFAMSSNFGQCWWFLADVDLTIHWLPEALVFGVFPLSQLCMDLKPRLIPPLILTLPSLKKFQNWENWVGNDSFNIKSLEISKFLGCYQPTLLTVVSASALATANVESVNYCQHVHQLLDCICIFKNIGHSRCTIGDQ